MHLLRITVLALFISIVIGCSSGEVDEEDKMIYPKYSPQQIDAWRADKLPSYLLEFRNDDVKKWRDTRNLLLNDGRTPDHIKDILNEDNAFTAEWREKLAKEGIIYNLLATLNGDSREEWRQSCSLLMKMDERTQERCMIQLLRRMQYGPTVEEDEEWASKVTGSAGGNKETILSNLKESFSDYNKRLDEELRKTSNFKSENDKQVQKAFWASQELALIGIPAIKYLLVYSRTFHLGYFFNDMIHNTFTLMGEIAVPYLVEELEKTDDLFDDANKQGFDTAELIFLHKRFLIKCLGNIYYNLNYVTSISPSGLKEVDKRVRDDLVNNKLAAKAITIELRDYHPLSDAKEYQFRIECIFALRKIGEQSACIPIVELWKLIVDDKDLEKEVKIALLDLSGRRLNTYEEWKKYTDTLTDPEDYD